MGWNATGQKRVGHWFGGLAGVPGLSRGESTHLMDAQQGPAEATAHCGPSKVCSGPASLRWGTTPLRRETACLGRWEPASTGRWAALPMSPHMVSACCCSLVPSRRPVLGGPCVLVAEALRSPSGSFPLGEECACNVGDQGSILSWEDPLEKWQPIPVFLTGEFHGQRSLAVYRP